MGRKNKTQFDDNFLLNQHSVLEYRERLLEIALGRFRYSGFPDTVDLRFMEEAIFKGGYACFFRDEEIGYLALKSTLGGSYDVYGIPIERRVYAVNGYHNTVYKENSVLIWNNLLHTSGMNTITMFARKLYNIDRTIDVNVNAQKTPVLITCDENERLSMRNLYMQYDGNSPVIYGQRGLHDDSFKVLKTDAPYMADKLQELKKEVWNEALTYLGVINLSNPKRERAISGEIEQSNSEAIISRNSPLITRQQACDEINRKFGLNTSCEYADNSGVKEVTSNE